MTLREDFSYVVPTGYGFVTYSYGSCGWFAQRRPNRAIAEKWAGREPNPVIWTTEDFYGRLPWDRDAS